MYYPAWLIPAAWTCAALAAVCGAVRFRGDVPAHRRLDLCLFVLVALALTLGGVAGILFNRRAPHLQSEGVVYDVDASQSHSASRQFRIFTRPEPAEPFELSWNNPHIRDGQLARVTWQTGSHRLLSVEILSGEESGYAVHQADGTSGSIYSLIGAALVFLFGVVRYAATAGVEDPDSNLHTAQRYFQEGRLQGDVDEASTLHLSSAD